MYLKIIKKTLNFQNQFFFFVIIKKCSWCSGWHNNNKFRGTRRRTWTSKKATYSSTLKEHLHLYIHIFDINEVLFINYIFIFFSSFCCLSISNLLKNMIHMKSYFLFNKIINKKLFSKNVLVLILIRKHGLMPFFVGCHSSNFFLIIQNPEDDLPYLHQVDGNGVRHGN